MLASASVLQGKPHQHTPGTWVPSRRCTGCQQLHLQVRLCAGARWGSSGVGPWHLWRHRPQRTMCWPDTCFSLSRCTRRWQLHLQFLAVRWRSAEEVVGVGPRDSGATGPSALRAGHAYKCRAADAPAGTARALALCRRSCRGGSWGLWRLWVTTHRSCPLAGSLVGLRVLPQLLIACLVFRQAQSPGQQRREPAMTKEVRQ